MDYIIIATMMTLSFALGGGVFCIANKLKHAKGSLPEASIPSSDEIRMLMVKNAYKDNTEGRAKRFEKAREIARDQIQIINRVIKQNARKAETSASITIHARKIEFEEAYAARQIEDHRIFLPGMHGRIHHPVWVSVDESDEIEGMLGALLKEEYEKKGYEVSLWLDTDWTGEIYTCMQIDWSENCFVPEELNKIQFDSQVDAYKSGVPLEDILA